MTKLKNSMTAVFLPPKNAGDFTKAFRARKNIQDFVFTDGSADKSVERRFAKDMDDAGKIWANRL